MKISNLSTTFSNAQWTFPLTEAGKSKCQNPDQKHLFSNRKTLVYVRISSSSYFNAEFLLLWLVYLHIYYYLALRQRKLILNFSGRHIMSNTKQFLVYWLFFYCPLLHRTYLLYPAKCDITRDHCIILNLYAQFQISFTKSENSNEEITFENIKKKRL